MLLLLTAWVNAAFADTYTYEFSAKVFSGNGEKDLGGVTWKLQTDAVFFGYSGDKGLQIGKAGEHATFVTLSTNGIQGTVSSVKIETSGAKGIDAELEVTVGGVPFGDKYTLTNVNTGHEFKGTASGEIALNYVNRGKALYIKRITVEYDTAGGEEPGGESGGDEEGEDPMENAETFVFNSEPGLALLGISVPQVGKYTAVKNDLNSNGITLANTNGTARTRVHNSNGNYTFRVYNGGSITLTSDNETPITQIVVDFDELGTVKAGEGTWNVDGKIGTWTGEAASVTLQVEVKSFINTINVVTGGTAPKPLQEVSGLAELKDVDDGTDVLLYITDADDVRVLFADAENNAFLRDKSGTRVYFKGVKTKPTMKFNSHLAGYVYGKKTSVGGMTVLEATAKTSSAMLLIAEPVMEKDVTPADVSTGNHTDHIADWVLIKGTPVSNGKVSLGGSDVEIKNEYGLTDVNFYHEPYDNARVDISAIAFVAEPGIIELRPIYNKVEQTVAHLVEEVEFLPIVYVIDEKEELVLPTTNMDNVAVRLERKFYGGKWNTLTLPFGVENVEGVLCRYKSVEGNVMVFEKTNRIEPGVPYLYKPEEGQENVLYKGVTLSNTAAHDVYHNGFHFVGTYKPYSMKTDNTERLVGDDNKLYSPTSETSGKIGSTGAYFVVPSAAGDVMVKVDENISGIESAYSSTGESTKDSRVYDLYGRFTGHGTEQLPKGIYIVEGKKIVVK